MDGDLLAALRGRVRVRCLEKREQGQDEKEHQSGQEKHAFEGEQRRLPGDGCIDRSQREIVGQARVVTSCRQAARPLAQPIDGCGIAGGHVRDERCARLAAETREERGRHRQANRTSDLAEKRIEARGVCHLVARDRRKRDRRKRHEQAREADPLRRQSQNDVALPGLQSEMAHAVRGPCDKQDSGADDQAGRNGVVDAPDEGDRDHHHDHPRHQRKSRVCGGETEQRLHEKRQEEHRRHEKREHERPDHRPGEEHRVFEEADVDRRHVASELAYDEGCDHYEREGEGSRNRSRREPIVTLSFLQDILERA